MKKLRWLDIEKSEKKSLKKGAMIMGKMFFFIKKQSAKHQIKHWSNVSRRNSRPTTCKNYSESHSELKQQNQSEMHHRSVML